MTPTNWNKQFKIGIRESNLEQAKHLIVKTLIPLIIKIKYKHSLRFQKVYAELPVEEGRICDVYHENIKTKEVYYYEIQKRITDDWLSKTKEIYENKEIWGIEKVDWILIELNKLSDNLNELIKELWELVV